jgi:hypothetical protein
METSLRFSRTDMAFCARDQRTGDKCPRVAQLSLNSSELYHTRHWGLTFRALGSFIVRAGGLRMIGKLFSFGQKRS